MEVEYLLDTSVVVDLLSKSRKTSTFENPLSGFLLPIVVVGELCYGAFGSSRPEEGLKWVREFASEQRLLDCDEGTAVHYGRLKNDLRTRGMLIPDNDLWIASLAIQHDYELLACDSHFDRIPGLRVTNPRVADHP